MKKLYTLFSFLFAFSILFAQVPQSFNYQAVLRDASGNTLGNVNVAVITSLLQGTIDGTVVFAETHTGTTNEYGLINLQIGSINVSGFSEIDWTGGPYFLNINVNGTDLGTSQLLSTPFALHAKTAENIAGGITEADPVFTSSQANNITATDITNLSNLSGTNTGDQSISRTGLTITLTNDGGTFQDSVNVFTGDMQNRHITNLAEPVNDQDAATKAYVDTLEQQIVLMQNSLITAGSLVRDYDGNIYGVVTIGTQIWMAENLKTTKYNDGTAIPLVTDNTEWLNLTTGAYCWYNNNEATYKNTYGALYIWYTVNTGKLCPTGWHVPTHTEWTTLTDYLGGTSIAGGKLKETGTTHWATPNTGATNETGFTALPGGNRTGNGTFSNLGIYGFWWSPTEYSASSARTRSLRYSSSSVARDAYSKQTGFSVRCLRD